MSFFIAAPNDGRSRPARLSPAALALRAALAAFVPLGSACVAAAHAQAAPGAIEYDIPAGPLASALNRYAQQSGVSIVMDAGRLRGLNTPGLQGRHTVQEGFDQLLRGSGYAASRTGSGYVLRPAPPAAPQAVPTLPAVTTVGSWNSAVGAGYVAEESHAGTKTDTPLIETPQAVTVTTRTELDDRKVQSLTEAIAYTPGVRTEQSGFDPRFDAFTVRGFDMTYNGIYRDGLRLPGSSMSVFKIEPYGVESVTVLRGPSSALYGLGSPGGVVDVTSKRPVDEPFGEVELQTGNYQRKQGQFDIGGRADDSGQWLYRLTGVVRDAGSPNILGRGTDDMTFIAPALTWKPDARTSITLLGEYQKSKTPAALPAYAWTGSADDGSPGVLDDYNEQTQEQYRVGYLAEHRVNDALTVRQNLRYGRANTHVRYTSLGETDEATQTIGRSTGYVHDRMTSFVVDNQVQADFSAAGMRHTVLAGLDYSRLSLDGGIGFGEASPVDASTLEPLGPVNDPPSTYSRYNRSQRQTGLYLQEQARFDRWVLTLTGRHDWSTTITDDLLASSRQKAIDRKFTGRAGLTYVFDNGIAPYASYSTSFSPNLGAGMDGSAFAPTTAKQVEVGVKYAPPGQDGYVAASLFQLTQNHSLVTDPDNPLFQVQTGEVRSRGVELEAALEVVRGLNLRGAYTYLAAVNRAGDEATVGRTLSGTPRHNFSLWADYEFQPDTALAGLGLGFGVRYTGTSWGDAGNTFSNSPHTLADAKISYDLERLDSRFKGWSTQVNARNLFDREYTTCDAGYCYLGSRRTVIASVRYRW
ncbi:TonB-dependent siderophore receptor [Bordetella genomosp. 13]|uniref:TonB-dependent siderophore receptor n=1 Tax=Bordetella genomosp. 13 TaxID=463040 RepID=A0A1W6ZEB4_9BORD|nr:TonB-dependent siderophore receptor [Bordetella genomosp. 13]ARP95716.1 TonB-dependent siderophore receptor [Bordetella genomosp. 13]